MIRIQDTKNMIGITIHGDYHDLKELYSALSNYLDFYFSHQDAKGSYSCYETILGLCYDIRHAFQGDRNIESVDNNHNNMFVMASCIYETDKDALQKERNKYKNGNLYFNVEILYPWAIYYLYTLQAVADDIYHSSWFEDDKNRYSYTEYQAETDLALIRYFVQLLWNKIKENIPENVMKILWEYTRIFNHVEYYFDYPDLYIEWLCTYWVNVTSDKKKRKELLPLILLELSAILDEDEFELLEDMEEAENEKKKKASEETDNLSIDEKKEIKNIDKDILNLQTSISQNILSGLKMYDNYIDSFYNTYNTRYRPMDELMDMIYDHVRDNGPFSRESYDEWLDSQLGAVDWDRLEW